MERARWGGSQLLSDPGSVERLLEKAAPGVTTARGTVAPTSGDCKHLEACGEISLSNTSSPVLPLHGVPKCVEWDFGSSRQPELTRAVSGGQSSFAEPVLTSPVGHTSSSGHLSHRGLIGMQMRRP